MVDFEYCTPTKVVFGHGTESEVGRLVREAGGHRALVHYGSERVRSSGLLDTVEKSLEAAGVTCVELGGVVPNPRLSLANRGVELGRAEGVDFVLAVGGGSVMDSAKAIAYGLANDFALEDLYLRKVATDKIAPLGVVATLAGTGSETSNSSVMDIDTLGGPMLKRSYNHECARPLFAVMDPELTYSVPAYQTAAPGADIMMHTMERYFTTVSHTELTDQIAEGLLRCVRTMVPEAIANPTGYDARANLLWASSLSHNGLTGCGTVGDWSCHAMGHELSAMFDVAHGASLTAIWSSWARYVMHVDPERFAQFGVNVFGVAGDFGDPMATGLAGVAAWEGWCHSVGLPTSIGELGFEPTKEQVRALAEGTIASRGGDHAGNFMPLLLEDVENILVNAL